MTLSSEQIKMVRERVEESNIMNRTLKDDVLDHLCCAIEIRIENGREFKDALKEALVELTPGGLDEIQQETVLLLNPFKIILMKKFTYITGLITVISMIMGLTFKILHMPGADELFNFGFFGFLLIFLPLITAGQLKNNAHQTLRAKLRFVFGFLSMAVISASMFFKIFHYDGASLLWLVGISLFSFGFLPFLFFDMYKKSIAN
jgi:hypothetical protein